MERLISLRSDSLRTGTSAGAAQTLAQKRIEINQLLSMTLASFAARKNRVQIKGAFASITSMKSILLTLSLVLFSVDLFAAESETDKARFQIPTTDEGLPGDGPIRRYDWFKNLW